MSQAERAEELQEWLDERVGGSVRLIDAYDLLSWMEQSDLEVGDVFDLDGPKVRAIIDEALENAESHAANERDVNRALDKDRMRGLHDK